MSEILQSDFQGTLLGANSTLQPLLQPIVDLGLSSLSFSAAPPVPAYTSWDTGGGLNETVSLAESFATIFGIHLSLGETIVLASESIAAKLRATVPISESAISLSDSLAVLHRAIAPLAETVGLNESNTVIKRSVAALSEAVTLAEAIFASRGIHYAISETLTISDSLAAILRAHPSLSETVSLSESLATIKGFHAALTETVSLAESLAAHLGIHDKLNETVNFSESLSVSFKGKASLVESIVLAESLVAKLRATTALAETVTLSESEASLARKVQALSETIAIAESVTGIKATGAKVALAETIPLSEAIAVKQRCLALLAESISLAESSVAALHAHQSLNEAISTDATLSLKLAMSAALSEDPMLLDETLLGKKSYVVSNAETVKLVEQLIARMTKRVSIESAIGDQLVTILSVVGEPIDTGTITTSIGAALVSITSTINGGSDMPITVGNTIPISATVKDSDGHLFDPDSIVLTLRLPSDAIEVLSFPDSVTRKSIGIYIANVTVNYPGTWRFKWNTTGEAMAEDTGSFIVDSGGF